MMVPMTPQEMGRKGGRARMRTMTAAARRKQAKAAIAARWDKHKAKPAATKGTR